MNTSTKPSTDTDLETAVTSNGNTSSEVSSASPGSRAARRGGNRFWLPLVATFIVIVGIAIAGAASRNDDRGIRGPADQAAPDAPRNEKVPTSSQR